MEKIVFEANIDDESVEYEDGGAAIIAQPNWNNTGGDENIFIRIQSWDESIFDHPNYEDKRYEIGHESIRNLLGKKVRVTVEVID